MTKPNPTPETIALVLQLCPALPGWFVVFGAHGAVDFEPIALWALCKTSLGSTKLVPFTADDFREPRFGSPEGKPVSPPHFLGVMSPSDTRETWERLAASEEGPGS